MCNGRPLVRCPPQIVTARVLWAAELRADASPGTSTGAGTGTSASTSTCARTSKSTCTLGLIPVPATVTYSASTSVCVSAGASTSTSTRNGALAIVPLIVPVADVDFGTGECRFRSWRGCHPQRRHVRCCSSVVGRRDAFPARCCIPAGGCSTAKWRAGLTCSQGV